MHAERLGTGAEVVRARGMPLGLELGRSEHGLIVEVTDEPNARFDGNTVIIERAGRPVKMLLKNFVKTWSADDHLDLARRLGYDVSTEEARKAAWQTLKEWRERVLEEQPGRLLRSRCEFRHISPLHVAAEDVLIKNEWVDREIKYRLYLAETRDGIRYIIFDEEGFVRPNRLYYSLERLGKDEILRILNHSPKRVLSTALEVLEQREKPPEKPKGNSEDAERLEQVATLMEKHCVFVKPIPSLRDPKALKGINWREYVEEALTAGASVDPRLLRVREAHALRGVEMLFNPHAVVVTNTGTGKSTFYQAWGSHIDKATPNSLVGYARSADEVQPGALDGVEEPFAVDQMESAAQASMMRYLYDLMESGKAIVHTGGVGFEVESAAPIAFLANPLSTAGSPEKSAQWILEAISTNPACGRRFGIILYSNDIETVKGSLTGAGMEKWKEKYVALIRAVEDFARKELRKIWSHPKTVEWLERPIPGYRERVLEMADKAKEDYICLFLRSHAEAQHRVRGAALRIALLYNLDKIALKEYIIDSILAEAEEHLKAIVQINLASIANMLEDVEGREEASIKAIFESLPTYMKVIILYIEGYKRRVLKEYGGQVPQEVKEKPIVLSRSDITLRLGGYEYLSKALHNFLKLKPAKRNHYISLLERWLGVRLRVEEAQKTVKAVITDWRLLPIEIPDFTNFTFSPALERGVPPPEGLAPPKPVKR